MAGAAFSKGAIYRGLSISIHTRRSSKATHPFPQPRYYFFLDEAHNNIMGVTWGFVLTYFPPKWDYEKWREAVGINRPIWMENPDPVLDCTPAQCAAARELAVEVRCLPSSGPHAFD